VQGQLRRLCRALRLIGSGNKGTGLALDYGINGSPGTGSPIAAFAMGGVVKEIHAR